MGRPWDADVDVTADLASRLIDDQFPALAPARAEPLAVGWDNAAFLVHGAWVFRLPRRRLGAECMRAELTWLPHVAGHLPVPVSVSTRIGRPSAPAQLAIDLTNRLREHGIAAPVASARYLFVYCALAATCWEPLFASGLPFDCR